MKRARVFGAAEGFGSGEPPKVQRDCLGRPRSPAGGSRGSASWVQDLISGSCRKWQSFVEPLVGNGVRELRHVCRMPKSQLSQVWSDEILVGHWQLATRLCLDRHRARRGAPRIARPLLSSMRVRDAPVRDAAIIQNSLQSRFWWSQIY